MDLLSPAEILFPFSEDGSPETRELQYICEALSLFGLSCEFLFEVFVLARFEMASRRVVGFSAPLSGEHFGQIHLPFGIR